MADIRKAHLNRDIYVEYAGVLNKFTEISKIILIPNDKTASSTFKIAIEGIADNKKTVIKIRNAIAQLTIDKLLLDVDDETIFTVEQSGEECAKYVECDTADYHWCCSKCGFGYTDNKHSYCYDCGAKMSEV